MGIDLNKQYQSMLIVWFALLMSVALYLLLTMLAAPPLNLNPRPQSESLLIVGLIAAGALTVLSSFLVKKRFMRRAIDEQKPGGVQSAMIVALAMCEVSALLGLLERFAYANREYFWLFVFAAVGMLGHFPKRRHLDAASYKIKGTQL
ncbi:MAG TPA: hypothetical protein VLL54_18635 [Pyrinomonadaceae bacterium]|nr:hypothetical protein [Pyrinomonadaceae bacterium]